MSRFFFSLHSSRNAKGGHIGLRSIARYITERRRTLEALRENGNSAKRSAQENAIVGEIGRIISSTLNIEEVYERFAEEVRKLIPFDRISININDVKENTTTIAYTAGIEIPGRQAGDVIPLDGSVNKEILRTRSSLLIQLENRAELAARFPPLLPYLQSGFRSMVSVPLISKDEVIGVLHLRSFKTNAYTEMDLKLAERVASQVASVIANAQLFAEHKRTEEALRESERKFRDLYDHAPLGYHEYDKEGRITNVNRTDSEMLGYTREEMIGQPIWKLNVNEETVREQVMAKLAGTLPPGKELKRIYRRKDGTTFPVLIEDRLILDENGRIKGIRCTIQDITGIKQADEALKRSEEAAKRLAQENATMAEIGRIINSSLNTEDVYERFAEEVCKVIPFDRISINTINPDRASITIAYSFGVKIEDREGLVLPLDGPFFEYILNGQSGFLIHPQDESELTERFPNFVRHFRVGIRTMIAVPLISKDQAIGILHIQSLKPNAYTETDLRIAERVGNQIAGAIVNVLLFAERKRAGEELRKAHEMLEKRVEERTAELSKANELLKQEIAEREQMQEKLLISERLATLGLFSGSISHELKNPLSTIDSSVYYLKTKLKDADEKVRTHLDRIKSSVGGSLAIIDSLRNLTQIKEPRLQRIDLKSVTSDAIVNAEVPETVNVIRNIAEQEVLVNADPEQLRMAFKNIVKNAIQAMDGKGTLEVTVGKIDDQVELSFTDTGPGIAPENRDKIFQPLFSTKAKGLGFGLSIAKMIIDKHSGTIQARSEPGKGATILIRLSL
jgi:PAS domain S-box-containing protein